VVKTYGYDVYGKVTSSSGSAPNEFDFAGQQTDPTGLQYLRARYYDPGTGRFLSRDPLSAGPGWSQHPLAYGNGNPARFVDPLGLCGWTDPFGCAGDVAGAALDAIAVVPYGTYYVSYETLEAIDAITQWFGPIEPIVDASLLQYTVPLVGLELVGLYGDVTIDMTKDAIGQGQGWADEGFVGDVCPDLVENLPGVDCPETYLPGVHGTKVIDEKGNAGVDTHNPSKVDINWGF
jgi:RHS repeat-associated protein